MSLLAADIIGWIGAALLLIAYYLVSTKRTDGESTSYQLLNLGGGLLLIVNTLYHRTFPPAFVNTVLAAIAILTLVRKFARRSRP